MASKTFRSQFSDKPLHLL